jgi:RHS repeat-associated protein
MAIENAYPGYLTDRINEQYEQMKEELWELVPGSEYIVDITPIPYPNFCDIGPGGQESALFFYHPDHLGSTGMITDNSANITQGFLYTPFGEIISDYSPTFHDSPMPNYAFNAKELDEENGMYYYSARYYAPPTFISRDPMFEKYPSISPYTYCANNPMLFVDPNGRNPILPPVLAYYVTAKTMELGGNSSRVRQAGYAMQHPINAARVGQYNPGSNNISTTASNFQVNVAIAAGLSTGNEGDQGNAFRHALWQGIITNEMGANHAQRIGNTHEDNLNIDLNQRTFKNMGEADKAVDLLNNIIGREIGEENKGASNQTMAKKVAKEFYENGLWTTSQNKDGSVSIQRTRITKEQYNDAINEINKKGNNGLDK